MAGRIPNIFKVPELKKRILFTLGIIIVYRLGMQITVPGVNLRALENFFQTAGGTLFGLYDMFVGGGLSRATIFALGIMPYISASIIFQLLPPVFPYFERLQKEGPEGRKKITQYTRYATVGLSFIQAYGFSMFINRTVPDAVVNPGLGFTLQTMLMLTTGAVFIMWLGEQITERGIGNGMSLLITFGIIDRLPVAVKRVIDLWRSDVLQTFPLLFLVVVMIVIVAGIIYITMAQRRLPIQIPRKIVGRNRMREGQRTHLPLPINSAGVMPIIFAQSIIIFPGTLSTFIPGIPWLDRISQMFQPNNVIYMLIYAAMIVFFTYFYTAIIFNPIDLAENMKKQGGYVPGIRPGARTAEYIDSVLTRVTFPGSLFLAAVAILPYAILSVGPYRSAPFFFGGTGLLIVVGVSLDTLQQIQSHLLLSHYDAFMKKGRVRGPRYI